MERRARSSESPGIAPSTIDRIPHLPSIHQLDSYRAAPPPPRQPAEFSQQSDGPLFASHSLEEGGSYRGQGQTQDTFSQSQSDHEGDDASGRRKRRRQALSCTECKRRKIRCDRNQPCAPCARRGEPEKCQWHAIEPTLITTDKFVTKAEHNALKARFDKLETLVHQRLRSESVPPSRPPPPDRAYNSSPLLHRPALPLPSTQHSHSLDSNPSYRLNYDERGERGRSFNASPHDPSSSSQRSLHLSPLNDLAEFSSRSRGRASSTSQASNRRRGISEHRGRDR